MSELEAGNRVTWFSDRDLWGTVLETRVFAGEQEARVQWDSGRVTWDFARKFSLRDTVNSVKRTRATR